MQKPPGGNPHPVEIRVIASTRLSPNTPHLILRDGLPWTVIVIREGSRYGEASPLWTPGRLTPAELDAWLTPWGVPPGANPWDHINPNRIAKASDIPHAHRLPSELEHAILALA